jgi:hypothetical protein
MGFFMGSGDILADGVVNTLTPSVSAPQTGEMVEMALISPFAALFNIEISNMLWW